MDSTEPLLARAVFAKSVKVLGWQPGAPKSREHGFPTKRRDFLKLIGPVTPPWVLYPSEIMILGSKELLLARAVFPKSIKVKVLGWQPEAPKIREHDFLKKILIFFFLKFIRPVTPLWVLQPSQIMHIVSTESLLARAEFAKSNKVL